MSVPYLCWKCSRRLLRPIGHLRRASFVSLGKLVDNNDVSQTLPQKEASANSIKEDPLKSYGKKRKSFAQQYQVQRKPVGVDKVLETLFSSSRAQESESKVSRYSRKPKEERVENNDGEEPIDRRLRDLQSQLHQGTWSLEHIWASCQQLLSERNWRQNYEQRRHKKDMAAMIVFRDVLLAVCSKERMTVHDVVVVRPATVIGTYCKHDIMLYWWHKVLWALLGQVLRLKQVVADTMVEDSLRPLVHNLLEDIIEVWLLFLARYDYVEGKPHLAGAVDPRGSPGKSHSALVESFSQFLPKHPKINHENCIVTAAMMTADLLEAEKKSSNPLLDNFLRRFPQDWNLDIKNARWNLSAAGCTPSIIDKALRKWTSVSREVTSKSGRSASKDTLGQRKLDESLNWSRDSIQERLSDIGWAYKKADVKAAVDLWQTYLHYMGTDKTKDKENNNLIFARFLQTFWALRCSDRAVGVWNHLVKSGHVPGQIHWTAMMTGCVQAQDVVSLQEIWSNMSRSQLKPDIKSWTTYIHGLIKLNKWQAGLQALDSLGRTWKNSSATGVSKASATNQESNNLTPAIEPVHGALSALIDIQKLGLTSTVIAWAESQNLRLETYTFNILLKPLVRTGTSAQIQSHLTQMADHGCPPDVATFTIILTGLISNSDSHYHNLPPEAQESSIISILQDMEAKGIAPSPTTYTALLNGLIGDEKVINSFTDTNKNNIPAARTILAHMQKRNIHPNPIIYTILISHYFRSTPPDLPAIDSLLAGIYSRDQTPIMDAFFFDRLIEGYADLDEIEKAFKFLRIVPLDGKSPGWWALYRVLAALERLREWDLCRELMRDVEDEREGLLRNGQGAYKGKRDFYELVDALREKGVVVGGEEQI